LSIADANPASANAVVKAVEERLYVSVRGLATHHAIKLERPLFLEDQTGLGRTVAQAL
jgi:hypothetical protein